MSEGEKRGGAGCRWRWGEKEHVSEGEKEGVRERESFKQASH